MLADFDLLTYKLPRTQEKVNIYPIGDTQVGSPNFNKTIWKKWTEVVLDDPYAKVVIVGDMLNNATKSSKSDSYGENMRPREAKAWLTEALRPISHTIIGAVKGNHEERSGYAVDDCPLYDVLAKLDLEDIYRENMAFIKLNVGERNRDRQYSYTMALAHGVGNSKTEMFGYTIDGLDIFITGHVHQPKSAFPAKIVIDSQNEVVRLADFVHVIVPSFDTFGGYTLRGMYKPQSSSKIPILELSGAEKEVSVHWIPLKV